MDMFETDCNMYSDYAQFVIILKMSIIFYLSVHYTITKELVFWNHIILEEKACLKR